MTPPVFGNVPFMPSATCPQCCGRAVQGFRSCCACNGVGRITSMTRLEQLAVYVWRRLGCRCYFCVHVTPVPPANGPLQRSPVPALA